MQQALEGEFDVAAVEDGVIGDGQQAARTAIEAFNQRRAGLVALMPIPPDVLGDLIEADEAEQEQWLQDELLGTTDGILEGALTLLHDHVAAERNLLVTMNQRCIAVQATAAASAALQRLQEGKDAIMGRCLYAGEPELRQDFLRVEASVIGIFDAITAGYGHEGVVMARRREVQRGGEAAWRTIRQHRAALEQAGVPGAYHALAFVVTTDLPQDRTVRQVAKGAKKALPVAQAVEAKITNSTHALSSAGALPAAATAKGSSTVAQFVVKVVDGEPATGAGQAKAGPTTPSRSADEPVAMTTKTSSSSTTAAPFAEESSAGVTSAPPAYETAAAAASSAGTSSTNADENNNGTTSSGDSTRRAADAATANAAAETMRRTTEEALRAASASCEGSSCGGGGGSSSSRLSTQPAGTTNSYGSRSVGGSYTLDKNGRWHDSCGRFCAGPGNFSQGTLRVGNGYTVDRNGRWHGPDSRFGKQSWWGALTSDGTVPLGRGYTMDQSGQWRGPDGRFCKNPYVNTA